MKKVLLLILVSIFISLGISFINADVIETSFLDKAAEIIVVAIPVFIIISLMYYCNRAIMKRAKSFKKEKPSDNGKV